MNNPFLALLFGLVLLVPIQDEQPKRVISEDRLTAEQVAVYRTVLEDYFQDADRTQIALNIANVTEPFGDAINDDGSCLRGLPIKAAKSSRVVHRIPGEVALGPKMVLVDPDRQHETIEKNDPSKAIQSSISNGRPLSDSELEDSVKQAFSTGLFTFSEIVFNREHTRAALWYGFHCGMLCGHGNTLVLTKVRGSWKVGKTCGGWIS